MNVDRQIIDQILQTIDIVDVINEYVNLKPAGANFKGLCPFHKEDTPSFIVSPQKQLFHCFGCHEGGDVIAFIMKVDRLTFPEAVKVLADRCGIVIKETNYDPKEANLKTDLFDINKRVADYYHRYLSQSKNAESCRDYIKKRGLSDDTVNNFMLGFAPNESTFLVAMSAKHRIDLKVLEQAGLIRYNKYKKYNDLFSNRLIFPISDVQNRIIAFGGRVLDNGLPKYLNSPETTIFKKSSTLYGLNLALPYIREEGYVIVLEGYMDVIGLNQAGIKNVVATLGTALTIDHLRVIRRYTGKIVVLFDGDAAGEAASSRVVQLFVNTDLSLKIASLPKGVDPDEYVQKNGKHALKKYLAVAKDGYEYFIDSVLKDKDLASLETKKELCKKIASIFFEIKSKLEQNYLLRIIADKTNEREDNIFEEIKAFAPRLRVKKHEDAPLKKVVDTISKTELELLKFLADRPEYLTLAKKALNLYWITSEAVKNVLEELFNSDFENINVSNFFVERLSKFNITKLLVDDVIIKEPDVVFADLLQNLEKRYLTLKLKILEKEIKNTKDISKDKLIEYEKIIKRIRAREEY